MLRSVRETCTRTSIVLALVLATLLTGLDAGEANGWVRSPNTTAELDGSSSGTVWLCRPGAPADPCETPLTTTSVSSAGSQTVENLHDATSPPDDCFYVYPTSSTQKTRNSNLVVKPAEIAAAVSQASPFSQVCRVWAPMYKQQTETDLIAPNGTIHIDDQAENIAYKSLLSAWKDYLQNYNDRRPVIFIGHSQGAAMLIRLIKSQVDPDRALRDRMISAIILGGNIQVPVGKSVGGTFKHIPACTSARQTGCVIAYSSFGSTPPSNSLFGRPGQGVSLQSNQTAKRGVRVLCTNPASLVGGAAQLKPMFYAAGLRVLGGKISTPWVTYP
ncbi:MAG: DUF3089 domain-containing protein, partial [Nitrososphaerales archaeon]